MEGIDAAFTRYQKLCTTIRKIKTSIVTEADTRLKVIDPMLTDILGYPHTEIRAEDYAAGDFIDYKVMVGGFARLIVEAKRDSRIFDLVNRGTGKFYKLRGPVFHSSTVKEGIDQAVRYCGVKNAELACVTNGQQWIVFRGNRLGDGRDTYEGGAFVFDSIEAVEKNFALFYDLLAYEAVSEFRYRPFFQEEEGLPVRAVGFRKPIRSPESKKVIAAGALTSDLDRVMNSFFQRLSGDSDPNLLANCFVPTGDSDHADQRLVRISEELVGKVRSINSESAEKLTEVVSRIKATKQNEFVLLVGIKGAGKSTFVDRFFKNILPRDLAKECIVARVNLASCKGNEKQVTQWLDENLLKVLENEVYDGKHPSWNELLNLFFDEYQRWSNGPHKHLYDSDKQSFKTKFGEHMEKRREERPHEYIQRILRDIVNSRKKVPCLVFDNTDHFSVEFQEKVFQYARSLYESEIALVMVPITDRTSWQLSRQGALRSFECESFFLPRPDPGVVLKRRIEYIESKLASEKKQPGTGYFTSRGIGLSINNLTTFTATLQAVFLTTDHVAEWVGNFANGDIRQCLELAKLIATSPHLKVDDLFASYVAGTSITIPARRIKQAMLRGIYDIYPAGLHRFIQNIYSREETSLTSPLLGVRILVFLRDVARQNPENSFVTVEQVVQYCEGMLVDRLATIAWLDYFLRNALCFAHDATITSSAGAEKVQISASGLQHLEWALSDYEYALAMVEITPLTDANKHSKMSQTAKTWTSRGNVGLEVLRDFIDYLIDEDRLFLKVPKHQSYESQRTLLEALSKTKRSIDDLLSAPKRKSKSTKPNYQRR